MAFFSISEGKLVDGVYVISPNFWTWNSNFTRIKMLQNSDFFNICWNIKLCSLRSQVWSNSDFLGFLSIGWSLKRSEHPLLELDWIRPRSSNFTCPTFSYQQHKMRNSNSSKQKLLEKKKNTPTSSWSLEGFFL